MHCAESIRQLRWSARMWASSRRGSTGRSTLTRTSADLSCGRAGNGEAVILLHPPLPSARVGKLAFLSAVSFADLEPYRGPIRNPPEEELAAVVVGWEVGPTRQV